MPETETPAPEPVMAEPQIYDPNPPVAVMPHADTITGAPPANSDAIGGEIKEDTFLGIRLIGPFAGMLLANNPGDPGIEEGVEAGLIVSAVPGDDGAAEEPRVPVIAGLSPSEALHTVTELTLVISGTDFADGDRVFADALEATTVTFTSPTSITAYFAVVSVETPRSVDVTVQTAEGDVSNAYPFEYTEDPAP